MSPDNSIRRIDDLGRIMVPKEIRRELNIKVSDCFKVTTNKDGDIVLRKIT